MKIQIDVPAGTMMLVRAEQIYKKDREGKVLNAEEIVIQRIEDSYSKDTLTSKLIKEQEKIKK